ncbi:hypothetical protein D082_24190 [Synechocystis sp. PCC 6714]|nr:hypothetical protein D082_24190 [Synechocystis sp. PCC 6714]
MGPEKVWLNCPGMATFPSGYTSLYLIWLDLAIAQRRILGIY